MAEPPRTDPGAPLPEDLRLARERAAALLPWAANGTLDEADRRWLDDWLAATERTHPALVAPLRTELAWLRKTAEDVRAGVAQPDPERGLDALLTRIAAESSAARPAPRPRAAPDGLGARLRRWIEGHALPLAGACAVLVITQAVTLALLRPAPGELDPLGGGSGVPSIPGTVLLDLALKPEAPEAAIRAALRDAHASIVAGPSALGLYVLRVETARADAALALLRSRTDVVESVERRP